MVTTDRVSAFDRVLASVPFKGQVLNQISCWWFDRTQHIIRNHLLKQVDPIAMLVKKCTPFRIEIVVRGYLTGTTATSIWVNYSKGTRNYCGHHLPDGLKQYQKLQHNIVTPTTKEAHDRLISPAEIVSENWMTQEEWDYCSSKALELFQFGQEMALERGLILVDTKYEMGRDSNGEILLIDEIHTPDSSRYWLAATYQERLEKGEAPETIDKDILRNWYNKNCDPYHQEVLPQAPEDLIILLSKRYIQLYELITGQPFEYPDEKILVKERLLSNIRKCPLIKTIN
jgi:phosphoribosylaminoimidazole-succinocarboxamide synthase